MAPKRPWELQPPEEESEDEEEGSESDNTKTTTTTTTQSIPLVSRRAPSDDVDEEDGESESESHSDSDHVKCTRPVKPIASKTLHDPPKSSSKKPRSEPGVPASSRNSRRKNKGAHDQKKQPFERLWSEDDEIVVLKGVLDYVVEKGKDPALDMTAFYDFIKNSLHIDASKVQLQDKVYRLKKKFTNLGNYRITSKPHERKAFQLAKTIWGADGKILGIDGLKVNSSTRKSSSSRVGKSEVSPHADDVVETNGPRVKGCVTKNSNAIAGKSEVSLHVVDGVSSAEEVAVVEVEGEANMTQTLRPARRKFRFWRGVFMEEEIVENGLELIDGAKRVELEERWKNLRVEEVELSLKRTELLRAQTALLLEALKSEVD